MSDLTKQKCEACNAQTPKLTEAELAEARAELHAGWTVEDEALVRVWKLRDFTDAFAKATAVGLLAQEEGHHPDLEIGWGRLAVRLTTHAIGGLSRNDVVMAAKIDQLLA
jgi:4a-hydroxytetrahydrobiopterin dehydratase